MSEDYDPDGRYDVFEPEGRKIGEVVKGVVYEGTPDFRREAGRIRVTDVDSPNGMTFVHNGATFRLVPQKPA